MMMPHANVFRFASGAGNAFAPASVATEPTVPEAIEEFRRAKRYRDDAMTVGLAVGGALGLALIVLRRRQGVA